ncbi:aconitate hydratase [Desulfotalea psychrophila]|uniref:Aconitate hydratase A n=1 Tax=Desulfotalea psychrophila (strain LSv54 / DSM 12343) TaxID=177439 RepID=Q6AS18_DESPS|nr:aconitate hydratase [Desulfotalea psychrophila]CAG34857.1 probable aconitate hydratase [Desulfotalea psychrophila LSv54]
MKTSVDSTATFIEKVYQRTTEQLKTVRARLNRPLTYTEKIMYGHLDDADNAELIAGKSYIKTRPDRIALQDATAQMAVLQFMLAEKDEAAVPVTIHCDHLIQAYKGAETDLPIAKTENNEVYNFLSSASKRYGFGYWHPGAGIIHQVVLERYAFPGLMMLGTDSHTPNAGGMGVFASGVGGADAVDVMVDMPWEVLHPQVVGVHLKGKLQEWSSPKDIILKLLEVLTCSGGTNRVFEYFGEGAASISATGKSTICNMGAELGATTSLFPYDQSMATYLQACGRGEVADLANQYQTILQADDEVLTNPESYYDKVVVIDLDKLVPYIVGPHSPDKAATVAALAEQVTINGYPEKISATLIGSCTNSSYEDMGRIAAIADQIIEEGAQLKTPLYITPGSEQVRATIERDGILEKLLQIGAIVLTNACGPCIGQWRRDDQVPNTPNTIVSSYNRNFPKRNDGNPETCSFLTSPETCMAYALHGSLAVNPYTTPIEGKNGPFLLKTPGRVAEVPAQGFVCDQEGFQAPIAKEERAGISVEISPDSKRLAKLIPFPAWDGKNFKDLRLLLKAKGKCTTDHISPAGPWLRFRGHLDNISDNMFSGAINSFTGMAGSGINQLDGKVEGFNQIARAYQAAGDSWLVVGDNNYGEGSSREHAAMSPRHMGAKVVICKAFARIHETNLKKQGVLPLTFTSSNDYQLVQDGDRIDVLGVKEIAPASALQAVLKHSDGSSDRVELQHSLNQEQISWFKAGSALNYLRHELNE